MRLLAGVTCGPWATSHLIPSFYPYAPHLTTQLEVQRALSEQSVLGSTQEGEWMERVQQALRKQRGRTEWVQGVARVRRALAQQAADGKVTEVSVYMCMLL